MKNKELEKHIDELKVLIEKEQYEEAVDYYIENIYSSKSKEEKILLENFLLKYTDKLVLKNSPESLLLIGMIYENAENYDEALEVIDRVLELNPEYAKGYNYRGNVYSDIKNYDKALENYDKAILLNAEYETAYSNRGRRYYMLKEYDKALSDYTKAIQLDENYVHAYNGRGIVYNELKEYNKALEDYTKVIQIDDNYAHAYNNRGNVYNDLGEFDKALEDYTKAIQIDKNYVYGYNGKGNVHDEQKDYDKAIKAYTKAIELDEKYVNAYNGRGYAYFNLKEYDNALQDYNKAIALDASYALAYSNKGRLYKEQKQYKKALRCFIHYIELAPHSVWGYYRRGEIYQVLEDVNNAIKDFKRFSELIEDDYWKAQALEKIKELEEEKDSNEIKNINDYVEAIKSALRFKETLITHYTSIAGAKILLLDPISSFRMSEANYMNDTTEGERLKETVIKKENLTNGTIISYVEKPFLGSFVDDKKCNDLTLWRMYAKSDGVDGRGCAITMDKEALLAIMMDTFIDEEYLKNNTEFSSNKKEIGDTTTLINKEGISTDEFGFYKVAYLNEKGKCIGRGKVSKSINDAIDGLRTSFKNILEKEDKDELLKIALTRLSEIEYLFKGEEYQHESEVRLILSKTGKGKHIKVDTDVSLIVPKVHLNIGNILPAVDSITIGPKVERPKEWASAFHYNFLEKGMKKSKVHISRLPYK